jgi:hypothetical protein
MTHCITQQVRDSTRIKKKLILTHSVGRNRIDAKWFNAGLMVVKMSMCPEMAINLSMVIKFVGKAKKRRIEWLKRKSYFESGYVLRTFWGTEYRQCTQCGDEKCEEHKCPDCGTWICKGIHNTYCDC